MTALANWGNVTPMESVSFVDEEGTYDFLVVDAWDSVAALPGTYDREKNITRHIGILLRVVGPPENPQMGRLHRVRLWLNSEDNQGRLLAVLQLMDVELSEKCSDIKDPERTLMSASELVGQYIKASVTSEMGKDNKLKFQSPAWAFSKPSPEFVNNPRELYPTKTDAATMEHYEKELARKNKKGDDDLPF